MTHSAVRRGGSGICHAPLAMNRSAFSDLREQAIHFAAGLRVLLIGGSPAGFLPRPSFFLAPILIVAALLAAWATVWLTRQMHDEPMAAAARQPATVAKPTTAVRQAPVAQLTIVEQPIVGPPIIEPPVAPVAVRPRGPVWVACELTPIVPQKSAIVELVVDEPRMDVAPSQTREVSILRRVDRGSASAGRTVRVVGVVSECSEEVTLERPLDQRPGKAATRAVKAIAVSVPAAASGGVADLDLGPELWMPTPVTPRTLRSADRSSGAAVGEMRCADVVRR